MSGMIMCSVKSAKKLLEHMDDNDMLIFTTIDKKTYNHEKPKRIKKKNGEDLIDRANGIEYQDNEYFGRLTLYGVVKEPNIIHNLLFPQIE